MHVRDKESFPMERLRAGVIGVGAIAQIMHLPYLRELDDRFQLAALCDVDPVVLAEVGRQYGVDRLFTSAEELQDERYGAEMFTSIQQTILASQPRDILREAAGSDDPSVLTSYFLLLVSSI